MKPHHNPLLGLSIAVAVLAFAPYSAHAQDMLAEFEKSVTEFELDNGLKFLVIERREAPVASFYTYADVGSVDEVKGITGMAHMFEHMAFKGTTTVGTRDLDKELKAMDRIDALVAELRRERETDMVDTDKVAQLQAQLEEATAEAKKYVVDAEFDEVVSRNGGVGLNATTAFDRTAYFYSLPSNKAELWFSLESDRFLNPVLREFYTERDVVAEERRMRTESNAFGRLYEEFLSTAFKAHPYGEPIVGHMSDIQAYDREKALEFFRKYYGASNLTIAITGDVDPNNIKKLANEYFGRLPKVEKPGRVVTEEPKQIGERRVIVEDVSQPYLFVGWHKGSVRHPDDPVFDILADILGAGRTSRFYKRLVEEEQLAAQIQALNSFAGFDKYPNLFFLFGVTTPGTSAEDLETAVYEIIDDVRENGVTDEELARAKRRARAGVVRQLQSNSGISGQMAYYEVVTGDWRNLFTRLEDLEAVTSDDIRRVVRENLTKNNRTVALIKTVEGEPTASTDDGEDDDHGSSR